MDIELIREKFTKNNKCFEDNIRKALANAPCDDAYRSYLLDIAMHIHAEIQQIQNDILELAQNEAKP